MITYQKKILDKIYIKCNNREIKVFLMRKCFAKTSFKYNY